MQGRAGDCSLVTAVQNRPHLGLCPGPSFPLQVRQELGVAFQTHTGSQASSRGEAKDSSLPSSPDRYLLEPTERPKESQASCGVWREDSVLLSMPGRKQVPHLVMTGAYRGFSRAAVPEWGFRRGTTGSSGRLSSGVREVRSPCAWRWGAGLCSRVMVGESGLKTRRRTLKVFLGSQQETLGSRDLSR